MDNPAGARAEAEPSNESQDRPANGAGSTEDAAPKKPPIKKRTKTGCTTCRKRRIKCDEAKPTCNNCIKSKRLCEGYSQRVVFKEPISAFHGGPYGPVLYAPEPPETAALNAHLAAAAAAAAAAAHAKPSSASSSQGPLPVIAPKPPVADFVANASHFGQGYHPSFKAPAAPAGPASSAINFALDPFSPFAAAASPHHAFPLQAPLPTTTPHVAPFGQQAQHGFSPLSHAPVPHPGSMAQYEGYSPITPISPSRRSSAFAPVSISEDDEADGLPYQRAPSFDSEPLAAQTHRVEEGYWYPDDDASMGESDDEDGYVSDLKANNVGIQVARRLNREPGDLYGTQIRSFSTYLGSDNVLASYEPSSTSSPLNDRQTAAVFWHFVSVTGASMSLYERHLFDPSPVFLGRPVPKARQHIWTYTFPIMAFNHPALLQAMLALGSLQIATLQGVPPTASMKHYHLSLRRIAKNYRTPSKRTQSATMAATLLLGFYEVWNSDHEKWCKHLWGARAILKEIPLREMTRIVLATRRRRREQQQREAQELRELREMQGLHGLHHGPQVGDGYHHGHYGNPYHVHHQPLTGASDGPVLHNGFEAEEPDDEVDTQLLGQLTGRPVSYEEDYGKVLENGAEQGGRKRFTARDLESYEHTVDLYWWYCKMDIFQSILGGTLLLMDYDLWTQVAPRAPIGRIDAIYGTFDHMMLLLGRLSDFSSKDLARKRRGGKTGGGAKDPASPASPQGFAGMMPTTGNITVPTGFTPPADADADAAPNNGPAAPGTADMSMEDSTEAALAEWEGIRQAFALFAHQLGPDFEPMGPEFDEPAQTPFGPALKYRTFSIAGIWMNYYMGLILLYRAHPSMPPVAMAAAGMAAKQTAPYATIIAQINAGLWEDCSNVSEIPTVVGSAFIESCFPMFVAGVQFQDYQQRIWSIKRLFDITRLTGWQSAIQIAGGCESAWLKAASLGRGPPYERPLHLQQEARGSVWNAPRRIDRRIRELDEESAAPNGGGEGGGGSVAAGASRPGFDHERRLVLANSEQTAYALGLLSVERELERLDLVSK